MLHIDLFVNATECLPVVVGFLINLFCWMVDIEDVNADAYAYKFICQRACIYVKAYFPLAATAA